jgi:tRNA uridine 5-carbamoylmethylation protein Kti12
VYKLIIMRGCPGSGKSFHAELLRESYMKKGYSCSIYSTDNFFMVDGEYKFDPSKLGIYHDRNLKRAIQAIQDSVNVVIVDNTNTTWKECKKYVTIALAYDYEVEFIVPETEWAFKLDELVQRNSHGVPREAIQKMLDRFEGQASVINKFNLMRYSYCETNLSK